MIHHDQIDEETRAFVRSVARALARGDEHLADEVEQETLVAALTHRPRDPGAKRGWLRTIALNSLRSMKGRAGRGPRTVRFEEGLGLAARSEDPADIHMRDEVRARLDQRLCELAPATRETIRLRVLEGLPPREVAGRLGIPAETVRTRTRRGLERLRESAERDLGARPLEPRRPFLALIVPLLRRRSRAAAAVVAGGAALVAIQPGPPGGEAAVDGGPARQGAHVAAVTPPPEPLETPPSRSAASLSAEAGPGAAGSTRAPREGRTIPGATPLEVRVVGPDGAAVAEAEIHVRRGIRGHVRRAGVTDADGTADIEAIPAMRLVAARGPAGWTSRAIVVDQPGVLSSGRMTLALEAHPIAWIDVRGHGADAPDLVVRCEPADPGVLCRLDAGTGGSGASSWLPAWTDAAGRRGVTWNDHAKAIVVERGGEIVWRTRVYAPFEAAPDALDLRPTWCVTGRLVTPSGRGVDMIEIELETPDTAAPRRTVQTAGNGSFRLDAIAADRVVLRTSGAVLGELERPRHDGRVTDLGERVLPGSGGAGALRVRVIVAPDAPSIRRVAGVEERERDLWTAHGLLTNHTVLVESVADPRAPATRGVEALVVERPRRSIGAVVVEYEDPAYPPTLVVRPPTGWGDGPVSITATGTAPARIACEIAADAAPVLARWRHPRSGLARSVRAPATGGDTVLVESPGLCAGTWDLVVVDAHGRSRERTGIRLTAGERVDLGRIDDPRGEDRAAIDWSPAIAAGAPGDRIVVEVRRAGRVVLERAGPRSMLRSDGWIGRTFEAAPYEIVVRSARRDVQWTTAADGSVPADWTGARTR